MLTDNNQIFRNWFVIIHRHLTKVSAKIIQCIIFERNELSITIYSMVPFSTTIGNFEFVHEGFPKQLIVETTTMK